MDTLLKNYKQSIETSQKLFEEIKSTNHTEDEKIRDTIWNIEKQINALESKKWNTKQKMEDEKKKKIDAIKAKQAKEQKVIDRVKKIYGYMTLKNTNQMNISDARVHTIERNYNNTGENDKYIYNYFDPVKTIREDEYCNIKMFIVPNGKPKNCYSLYVIGICPFFSLPNIFGYNKGLQNYISGIHEDNNPEIRIVLRASYSKKELLKYAEKTHKKIDALLQTIDERAVEYNKAIALLNDVEWLKFYYEKRKEYYETDWSNGTKEPEYKEVCKKLEKLKRG